MLREINENESGGAMALPAGRADWRGCPPDGNERINALLNCVLEVEAEIPVLHGEDPGPQAR